MTKRLLALLLLGVAIPTAATAQVEFPAGWAGIWEITTTERACGSTTVIDMYTESDSLCAGELFDAGDEADFQCTGAINDNSIDVTCTGSVTEGPCTITFTFSTVGTRSGDSFSGTDTFSVTFDGCGPLPDTCEEATVTGTRTGPPPPECGQTPVTRLTWHQIKNVYR